LHCCIEATASAANRYGVLATVWPWASNHFGALTRLVPRDAYL
jgi:hypothetical protein